MADDCLFCRIVSKEVGSEIIEERPTAIAFRDVNPQAPVHVLIVPKEHLPTVADLLAAPDSCEVLSDIFSLVNDIAISEGISQRGYRLVANVGEEAGRRSTTCISICWEADSWDGPLVETISNKRTEMSLKETLGEDSKNALRSGEKLKLSTIRMVLAEIRNAEIAKREDLTDEEVLQVVSREARKRKEAIDEFAKGGRQDLVDKETYELSVLEAYLPEQMSDEEVRQIVSQTIEEVGASSPSDLGKVMSAVMPRVKGQADGKKINQLVREMLAQ